MECPQMRPSPPPWGGGGWWGGGGGVVRGRGWVGGFGESVVSAPRLTPKASRSQMRAKISRSKSKICHDSSIAAT